jgi:hypothetical protein
VRFSSRLVITGVVTGAAITYYVKKRRARTGEGYLAILIQLPSEAQRRFADARRRAGLAIEDGRVAARDRATELARQLAARTTSARVPLLPAYSSRVPGPPLAADPPPAAGPPPIPGE